MTSSTIQNCGCRVHRNGSNMGFRNNTEAENLRLRNELRETQERLAALEAKSIEEKKIKDTLPKPPGWFATKLTEYRNAKAKKIEEKWDLKLDLDKRNPFSRSALKRGMKRSFFSRRHNGFFDDSLFTIGVRLFMLTLFCVFIGAVGHGIYLYCTDITEGRVVGSNYTPEKEICSYDENQHLNCSTFGPYWYLTIQDGSERATWSVPKSDYDHYRIGDQYCYEDFFRGNCSN